MSASPESALPVDPAAESRRRVAVASLIMIVAIFLSRIAGLARLIVLGAQFGVNGKTSAYNQAFVLPEMVNMLIGGGVIASAFIPFYTQRRAEGDTEGAHYTFSSVFTAMLVSLTVLCIAIAICAPLAVEWFMPSTRHAGEVIFTAEDQQWWIDMTRIMVGAQVFFVTGGLFMGVLHAHQHFWAPAIGPIIYSVAIIIGAMVLGDDMGIKGAAWAVPIGAFVGQWVIQIPVLRHYGVRYRPVLDLRDAGLRRVFAFMAPVILGLSVMHINMLVARALSASVSEKGPTYFEYAFRITMFPVGVLAMGAAMAAYPTMADAVARRRLSEYRSTLADALRRVFLFTAASTAVLMVAPEPIVGLLFGYGKFGQENVQATASALVFFSTAVIGMSVQQVLIRGFYALDDSKSPVAVGILSVGLAYVSARLLAPPMGVEGVCLGLGIASTAAVVAMWVLLSRREQARGAMQAVLPAILRATGATALCGLGAHAGMLVAPQLAGGASGPMGKALAAAPPLMGGFLGFLLGSAVFRAEDGLALMRRLAHSLRRVAR